MTEKIPVSKIRPNVRVFAIVACSLAVLWAGVLWTNRQSEQQGLEELRRETSALALLFATHTQTTFRTVDHALLGLRAQWVHQPGEIAKAIEARLDLLGPAVVQIGITDAKGYVAYSRPVSPKVRTSADDREFFRIHLNTDQDRLFVGRPIKGKLTGKWSIPLSRPIFQHGKFAGVVFVAVDPNYFVSFYQGAGLGQGGAARMIRDTGDIMARSSEQDKYVGKVIKPSPYADPGAPLQGSFRRSAQVDGVERLSSYYRLPQYGVTVVVGPSVAERLVAVRQHQRQLVWAAAALSALMLAIMWLVLRNIARAQEAQKIIRESEERFRSLFASMSEGVALHRLVSDAHGQAVDYEILDVNPAFEVQTGLSRGAVVGKSGAQAYGVSAPPFLDFYAQVARTGQSARFEYRFESLGKDFVIRVFTPQPGQFATVLEDITERKQLQSIRDADHQKLEQQYQEIVQLQEQLQRQVLHDPLTGLHNRRFLDEALPREIVRAKREGYPLSFIMLDVDRFKSINDTYGHAVGDAVLSKVAAILKKNSRESDILCRFGGEEFLLVVPHMTPVQALQKVEACRQRVEAAVITHGELEVSVTLSAGVAGFPAHGADIDTLIKRADTAMYQSKKDGRNRVTMATL